MIYKNKAFSILEMIITIIMISILGYIGISLFLKIEESNENNIIDKSLNFYVDMKTKDIQKKIIREELVNRKQTEYNFQN